ncbi:MAG: chemotaxis protein [Thermodesulfobacteriota bacterium]|nr:chemotaxis protein [Thermodesulfobacteriota bacterium]
MTVTAKDQKGILLEAGTNEFEILEYYLYDQTFGINVHKLKEIVIFSEDELTRLPECHNSILGTILLRGDTVPLVNLVQHLGKVGRSSEEEAGSHDGVPSRHVVLVCEFNEAVIAFLVHGVNQIHRLSWSQVKPMDQFFDNYQPRFTGTVTIGDRDILIVDMEHISYEIFGDGEHYEDSSDSSEEATDDKKKNRGDVKLFFAEDSAIIRQGIMRVLHKAGYVRAECFSDGLLCWEALVQAQQDADLPMLVVSDIEMPELDGLALCRRIKENRDMQSIKVVMYSSLINENTSHKCVEVGADDYTSKPDVAKVVALVDKYCLAD